MDLPVAVEVITREEIKKLPGVTLDEKLSAAAPGLVTARSSGIYSFASVLTMRGFPGAEQGRTLVLLDGVPVNTSATGAVNWNRLSTEGIERVEIFKGPASSLYGSNAASGVINVITKKSVSGYSYAVSYGTYKTFNANVGAGVIAKRLTLSLRGNYLSSDGYISTPISARDAYTVKKYVREKTAELNSSVDVGEAGKIDIQYSHYDGLRGEGVRILTADGTSRRYRTDFTRVAWNGAEKDFSWQTLVYYQRENYIRLNEYYRNGIYNRVDTGGLRNDVGAQAAVSMETLYGINSTFGADYKSGSVDVTDHQLQPSASVSDANDRGKMDLYAPYFQAEKKLLSDRLKLLAGLRYDNAFFHDGYFSNTAVGWTLANGPLDGHRWESLSPKLSAGWDYDAGLSQYISYGRGFRGPALEDMCLSLLRGSGLSARFTMANPDLKPEKVDTVETGFRFNPFQGVYVDPNAYYTIGSDFIYEVNTGGTINISGSNKTVYKKQNVGRVKIYGVELPAKFMSGGFSLSGSYGRSFSHVDRYPLNTALEGKNLTYSPRHSVSVSAGLNTNPVDLNLGWKYKSKQFTIDDNTSWVKAYSVFSASAARSFTRGLKAKFSVNNIFDKRFQESSTDMAPGRDITASLEAKF